MSLFSTIVMSSCLSPWGWYQMATILQKTYRLQFLQWKCLNSDYNFPMVPIDNKSAFVEIMADMMAEFMDTYIWA